ncbi:MAG: ABC transporter permease, partial [Planctomycetes bacterium]|nr:ABC transporter permease [Planctomycetota bacterium]
VRGSLAKSVQLRLGRVTLALSGRDRFFRTDLADALREDLHTDVAPVLQLPGLITNDDGSVRASRINILGVDDRFYKVGPGGDPFGDRAQSGVVLNQPLALRLGVNVGDEVFIRLAKPSLMPRDIPLTPDSDLSVAKRLRVTAIAGEEQFARFSLQSNQVAPFNAFVDIAELSEMIDQPDKANLLLVSGEVTPERAEAALKENFTLEDASLSLNLNGNVEYLEITSSRVLIDDILADASIAAGNGTGILTYFVNEIAAGEKTTPYSFVAAMDEDLLGERLASDEVIINRWLADDLGVKAGDEISVKYFIIDAGRKLIEQVSRFKVKRVTPIAGKFADKTLMPDFPGLADSENCRDWDPGIPIDLDKIRDKPEQYWDDFTGTLKAFISLSAGQEIWSNRYGSLTAIRVSTPADKQKIETNILESLNPASLGFYFQTVRDMGVKASGEGTDFGGLVVGLSMFLIAAAVIMTAMVFVFGIESRIEQTGMLTAVGWPKYLLWRLYVAEGAVLAIAGAITGGALGLLYTKAMIWGLSTLWQGAVAGSAIEFYASGATIFGGIIGAVAMCMFAICVTLRKQLLQPVKELLAGNFAG